MRTKIEHNALTDEVIERPYTDEENAQADLDEEMPLLIVVVNPIT